MKLKDLFEIRVPSLGYASNHEVVKNYSGGNLDLSYKGLYSLDGCPEHVTGHFKCAYATLPTLKGGPQTVDGDYICYNNNLMTLDGAASHVGGSFICHGNPIKTLEGIPKFIGGDFSCQDSHLVSLEGIHEQLLQIGGSFDVRGNHIRSHVLGLTLIKGLVEISTDKKELNRILNRHLGKGRAGMLMAQEELIEAGLEEFAQL